MSVQNALIFSLPRVSKNGRFLIPFGMTSQRTPQRVGLYLRVSTLDQETENQLRQLRALCEVQGRPIYREYIDIESGRKGKRERTEFAE